MISAEESISKTISVQIDLSIDVPLVVLGSSKEPFQNEVFRLIGNEGLMGYEDKSFPSHNSPGDLASVIYRAGMNGTPGHSSPVLENRDIRNLAAEAM